MNYIDLFEPNLATSTNAQRKRNRTDQRTKTAAGSILAGAFMLAFLASPMTASAARLSLCGPSDPSSNNATHVNSGTATITVNKYCGEADKDEGLFYLTSGPSGLPTQYEASIKGSTFGTLTLKAEKGVLIEGTTTFSNTTSFNADASFNGNRIRDIGDATEDGDAINLGQLKKIGLVNDAAEFLTPVVYDDSNPGRITFRGDGFGVALANVAPGLISSDSMEAINGSQFFALQNRVQVLEVQIGNGGGGGSGGNDDHHGSGSDSLDIGSGNDTAGANAIGYGNDNQVGGDRATGIGNANTVTARNGIAMGNDNKVTGANGIGIGNGTQANGNDSVAIGHGARASATNSVALGSGSVADRSNTVSVGAVGNERQIANVAAGSLRTDAANWGQVQDAVGQVRGAMNGLRDWANRRFDKLDRRIDGMGAVSAANAQMAINAGGVQPGKGRFAVGMGFAGGEGALAVGYAKAITERVRLSVGGSTGSAQTTAGIGIGIDL